MDSKIIQQVKQRFGIVGNSEGLNRAIDIATQVASTDLSVLIVGESGVGKEVLPRVIHENSMRKHNKYFAINCGSLPEGTIDSELFGHKKGAFTGSIDDREGYFSVANKGTLFLDEVGELPLATQARLLRVLETGEYIRVGESEVRKTDVRIVAATNVNMQKAIKEGKFREDLYYRLNTIPITMPPLRERGRDIELLFRKFAFDMAEKYGVDPVRLTEDGRELMMNYKWPGNIRQLRNLTEQISILSRDREISAEVLKQYGVTDDSIGEAGLVLLNNKNNSQRDDVSNDLKIRALYGMLDQIMNDMAELKKIVHANGMRQQDNTPITIISEDHLYPTHPTQIQTPAHQPQVVDYSQHIYTASPVEVAPIEEEEPISNKELMKRNIISALNRNKGNRKKTANELGISDRTLYRKIKEFGLDI